MAKEDLREQIRKDLLNYWGKKGGFGKYKYSDDYKYYVKDINENLIGGNMDDVHIKMFENGSGSELKDTPAKAKAIDSSSMLAYNFFRNINDKCTITIDEVEYNKVFFEVKLRTLSVRSTPANLDVVLVSKDKQTVLFIESKFLEYLETGTADFSDSYTKKDSYYNHAERRDLLSMSEKFDDYNRDKTMKGHYKSGIKQIICHLIGISNLKNSGDAQKWFKDTYKNSKYKNVYTDSDVAVFINPNTTFRFMNLIFCPEKAEEAFEDYKSELEEFLNNKEKLPEAIRMNYIGRTFIMTYKELFEKLPEKLSVKKELKERYIKYHSEENLP